MEIDEITINTISNSLNAKSSLLRIRYLNTKDKRDLDMSLLLERAQTLISMLQDKVDSQK